MWRERRENMKEREARLTWIVTEENGRVDGQEGKKGIVVSKPGHNGRDFEIRKDLKVPRIYSYPSIKI